MLSCKEATQLLSLSQDRDLSLWEKAQLKLHIFICRNCTHCQKNMNFLRKVSLEHKKRDVDNS